MHAKNERYHLSQGWKHHTADVVSITERTPSICPNQNSTYKLNSGTNIASVFWAHLVLHCRFLGVAQV
jgi:hypothetical protein